MNMPISRLNSSLEECFFFSQSLQSHPDIGSFVKRGLQGCKYLRNSYTHFRLQGYPFYLHRPFLTFYTNSKPDHPPPRSTPEDSYILVASGVGFSLPCLARRSARGILNQNKNSIILKKARFLLCHFKSSSSFHMFTYARSEQCDFIGGPTYPLII